MEHNLGENESSILFEPECLTLYLSDKCNLDCNYCYSKQTFLKKKKLKESIINLEDIQIAAEFVAKNCYQKEKPFVLVFHGGGEPTLFLDLIKKIFNRVYLILDRYNLPIFSYIATNGIMSKDEVRWLADNFCQIGISCDGPPDIQDLQRKMESGDRSSEILINTVNILNRKKADFIIRSTITPTTYKKQVEIVDYFINVFKAKQIRFEPVYGNVNEHKFDKTDANEFVENFLNAKKRAEDLGANLSISGVRPEEIHGPYCNILKNVLQLSPEGYASACFLHAPKTENDFFNIGSVNRVKNVFEPDKKKIKSLKKKVQKIPTECKACINKYHCARNCPDICYLNDYYSDQNFRCLIQKKITEIQIKSKKI